MLQAILNGKAGRIEMDGRSVSWRELFRRREDLLTAALFGRFSYLDGNQQSFLLQRLLGEAFDGGRLEEIHFWPKYEYESTYVEPDLLLEFERELLLVEIKPPANAQQVRGQWRKQVRAVRNADDLLPRPLLLLALGGNTLEGEEWVRVPQDSIGQSGAIRVIKREWGSVRDALLELQKRGTGEDIILTDMLEALRLFGIEPALPSWRILAGLCHRMNPALARPVLALDFESQ